MLSTEQWQEGIRTAFTSLEEVYSKELEQHKLEMQEWSKELSLIIAGKAPFSIEQRHAKYISDHLNETYSKIVLAKMSGKGISFMQRIHRIW